MRELKRRLTITTKLHITLPFLKHIFGSLLITIGIFLFIFVIFCGDQTLKPPSKEYMKKLLTLREDPIPEKEILQNINNLWFMKDGWIRPEDTSKSHHDLRKPLWPYESDSDRIIEQLMFVPPNLNEITNNGTKLKKILMYGKYQDWKFVRPGRRTFLKDKCPVSTCTVTYDKTEAATADAIFFQEKYSKTYHKRFPSQVWIIYSLESPFHIGSFKNRSVFNWTATYRRDSDIVIPYGKFVPYVNKKSKIYSPNRNYAVNKSRKVAWFVSNCKAKNYRLEYADKLSQYIEVDIYGICGTKLCPQSQENRCFKLLDSKYKFYLAFENSNCKDYITEKLFLNALNHDIVPIVMGARKEDYLRVAPPNSFIFVEDFKSAKDLANHLKVLDKNDTLYNEYFRWKGTGEFINTYFWCRICALLHDKQPPKIYNDIELWWNGPGTCVRKSLWASIIASWWI